MAEFAMEGDTLTVQGPLEVEDEEDLRKWCLELLLTGAKALTIDMKNVSKIDSRCIGVLATLWIDLSVVGRTFVLLPSEQVRRILDVSGLSQVFLSGDK